MNQDKEDGPLGQVIDALMGDVLAQEKEDRVREKNRRVVELSEGVVKAAFERFLGRSLEDL